MGRDEIALDPKVLVKIVKDHLINNRDVDLNEFFDRKPNVGDAVADVPNVFPWYF